MKNKLDVNDTTYIMQISKPLIEYHWVKLNYYIHVYPELGPMPKSGDYRVTVDAVFNWIFGEEKLWMVKTMEYFKTYPEFDEIISETRSQEISQTYFLEREYSDDSKDNSIKVTDSDISTESEKETKDIKEQILESLKIIENEVEVNQDENSQTPEKGEGDYELQDEESENMKEELETERRDEHLKEDNNSNNQDENGALEAKGDEIITKET